MMEEIWRTIPGFSKYEASSLGRIRGQRGIKKANSFNNGYMRIGLYSSSGAKIMMRVNRIIAITFHGNPPTTEHQAAHIDGNKLNNRADNIEWKTGIENMADRHLHGTTLSGPTHPCSKISHEEVISLRMEYEGHMRKRKESGFRRPRRGWIQEAAIRFKVSDTAIKDVLHGRSWRDDFDPTADVLSWKVSDHNKSKGDAPLEP